MRALTADQVAAEFGRPKEWLYDNWRKLVRDKKMPRPLHDAGTLSWSAAQFYAWLDRDLPKDQKAAVAALRAVYTAATAAHAGHDPRADDEAAEIERWKEGLDRRYGGH
jgi:hypothetical protein